MLKIDNPLLFRLKFVDVPFGVYRSTMLGSAESEMVRLISRGIIFAEFQHVITIPKRHRRNDGQTTCLGKTALRIATRGIKQTKSVTD